MSSKKKGVSGSLTAKVVWPAALEPVRIGSGSGIVEVSVDLGEINFATGLALEEREGVKYGWYYAVSIQGVGYVIGKVTEFKPKGSEIQRVKFDFRLRGTLAQFADFTSSATAHLLYQEETSGHPLNVKPLLVGRVDQSTLIITNGRERVVEWFDVSMTSPASTEEEGGLTAESGEEVATVRMRVIARVIEGKRAMLDHGLFWREDQPAAEEIAEGAKDRKGKGKGPAVATPT
ncbi:hypothetical protein HDV00_004835, partial [Rhizophlyctis rosea]